MISLEGVFRGTYLPPPPNPKKNVCPTVQPHCVCAEDRIIYQVQSRLKQATCYVKMQKEEFTKYVFIFYILPQSESNFSFVALSYVHVFKLKKSTKSPESIQFKHFVCIIVAITRESELQYDNYFRSLLLTQGVPYVGCASFSDTNQDPDPLTKTRATIVCIY